MACSFFRKTISAFRVGDESVNSVQCAFCTMCFGAWVLYTFTINSQCEHVPTATSSHRKQQGV